MDSSARRRLSELTPLAQGDGVLDAVAIAIAVEDSFAIVLDDADMTPSRLCSPAALAATVER